MEKVDIEYFTRSLNDYCLELAENIYGERQHELRHYLELAWSDDDPDLWYDEYEIVKEECEKGHSFEYRILQAANSLRSECEDFLELLEEIDDYVG